MNFRGASANQNVCTGADRDANWVLILLRRQLAD